MIHQMSRSLAQVIFRFSPDRRPWIIWVDTLGIGKLHLFVVKPRYNFALSWHSRWKYTEKVHSVGPLAYTNPDEKIQLTMDLIDIGIEHIPPNRSHEFCYSLGDVNSVVQKTWAP